MLFIATLTSGIALANAPSVGKSRIAANRVFDVIDEKSLVDVREKKGVKKI